MIEDDGLEYCPRSRGGATIESVGGASGHMWLCSS
jgi:hypothetical protein